MSERFGATPGGARPSSFGRRLRRLRLAAPWTGRPRPHLEGTRWDADGHLSVNALAHLARTDPAHVHRLEAGERAPSRGVVLRLAAVLGCSDFERALLLADAGFWPWPDADEPTTDLLVGLAAAVLEGDYRPLEDHVRTATGAPRRAEIDGFRARHQ